MEAETTTMDMMLAVFRSLNQVSLIRRNLHQRGIYVEMTRAPQCLAATGCSFGLRCDAGQLAVVLQTSQEAGITIPGVFREHDAAGRRTYEPLDPAEVAP